MYPTYRDTQQCISNNNVIIQQVVVEWNRKSNKKVTKNKKNKMTGEMQLWDVDNFRKNGASSGKISTKEILRQNVWFANIYSSSLNMVNST